jgi:4-amino-4-deoxy-L-arabinose transferase-like glycosyltransferase
MPVPNGSPSRTVEVVALTILAAFLRGGMLLSTIDVPGDGPVKAWMAYTWAHAPHLVLHGTWPPGLVYLTGPLTYFLPTWMALRLFNAIVGTATVPVLFTAVKRVFGPSTALIAAAFIAVLPLHVELSATSLTEAGAMVEFLLGITFLTMAAEPGRRHRAVLNGLALSCFLLASMTRYELWFLLPLFPCYYWLRTRDWVMASVMTALLVAFPTVWTIGNYIYEGNALLGIGAAMHDRGFGDTHVGVPLTAAVKILVTRFAKSLGWVLVVLLVLGMVMECRSLLAGRLSPERILYFAVVLVLLLGTGAFTVVRGETVPTRNLLFGLVFSMPMATIPISARLRHIRRSGLWFVIVLALIYMLGSSSSVTGRMETALLTRAKPEGIMRFEQWLNKSPWRDQPLIFTRMGWQPTYLPYYFPAFAWRMNVISEWADDGGLRSWTQSQRPALLVTQRGDEAYVQRFVRVTGIAVEDERLVHRDGEVEVYELVTSHLIQ